MSQPGMRVTLDAAMRARDVSRADVVETGTGDRADDGDADRGGQPRPQASPKRSAKGERRRLGKRQAAQRRDEGTGER